ncbi:MAG: Dabb family protein [Candidatus Nitrospinota bacterium M3_3B_026]
MIRHIVFFKLKNGVTQEQADELLSGLHALEAKIDLVRDIEVAWDIGGKPNSYDIVLNSLFDSMEDVEKYAAHPEHVKVVELINDLCASHVKVDYDTNKVAI